MSIKIYNTLTQSKTPLKTLKKNKVGMYVCGPTVYDDCHIGHLMGPVIFDSIARWLKASKYEVIFVNNITDIDDKIINKSISTGQNWLDITKIYTQQYWDFLKELNVISITDFPKCTDYIPQMVAYIEKLISSGRAYEIDNGVYYEVEKQNNYGKLTKRNLEDLVSGSRVESSSQLNHPADFCLWKKAKPNEPFWPSPWGDGRPGWHLECSVMSNEILGETFDIHGGGDDLKFPHHENEIAQGEAHGGEYATYWMHNGLIQYEGIKIGKSDPRMQDKAFANQFKARNLLDTYGADTIRFFLLQGHYRRPNDFAPKNLENAKISLHKLYNLLGKFLDNDKNETLDQLLNRNNNDDINQSLKSFIDAMNDDFNTGLAIGHIFTMVRIVKKLGGIEKENGLKTILYAGRILGLFPQEAFLKIIDRSTITDDQAITISNLIQSFNQEYKLNKESVMDDLLNIRQELRSQKNYDASDKIRDTMKELNITIKDSPTGPTWQTK
ncbi:MAG: cysteine--tRNA ligase [Planctomycetota bacterium]|nr:MAG: cysteine--tRNA ligase [Planctomycetota bacterium]